jgi:hypothetical protein
MADFKPGDRVLVTDPALAAMRAIMRDATGQEPAPNHHGTVDEIWVDGTVLINFDDGVGAPYPPDEVRHLPDPGASDEEER